MGWLVRVWGWVSVAFLWLLARWVVIVALLVAIVLVGGGFLLGANSRTADNASAAINLPASTQVPAFQAVVNTPTARVMQVVVTATPSQAQLTPTVVPTTGSVNNSGGWITVGGGQPSPIYSYATDCVTKDEVINPGPNGQPVPRQSGKLGSCTLKVTVPPGWYMVVDAYQIEYVQDGKVVRNTCEVHAFSPGPEIRIGFTDGAMRLAPEADAQQHYIQIIQKMKNLGECSGNPQRVNIPQSWG